eukprot:4645783-Prymnesium_polylepis.1
MLGGERQACVVAPQQPAVRGAPKVFLWNRLMTNGAMRHIKTRRIAQRKYSNMAPRATPRRLGSAR